MESYDRGRVKEEEDDDGDDEEGGEDDDEDDDDDDDDSPVVQCDRRDCRRELTDPSETVYTSSLGQDFCVGCTAKFPEERRARMRKLTVAERLAEAAEDEAV